MKVHIMQILEAIVFVIVAAGTALLVSLGLAHAGTEIMPGIEVGKDAATAIAIAAIVGRAIPKQTQRKLEDAKYVGWIFTLAFGVLQVVGFNTDRIAMRTKK